MKIHGKTNFWDDSLGRLGSKPALVWVEIDRWIKCGRAPPNLCSHASPHIESGNSTGKESLESTQVIATKNDLRDVIEVMKKIK